MGKAEKCLPEKSCCWFQWEEISVGLIYAEQGKELPELLKAYFSGPKSAGGRGKAESDHA